MPSSVQVNKSKRLPGFQLRGRAPQSDSGCRRPRWVPRLFPTLQLAVARMHFEPVGSSYRFSKLPIPNPRNPSYHRPQAAIQSQSSVLMEFVGLLQAPYRSALAQSRYHSHQLHCGDLTVQSLPGIRQLTYRQNGALCSAGGRKTAKPGHFGWWQC